MANRPGVMIYFDMLPALKRLTKVQKADLFEALLEYAQYGVLPEFDDIGVSIAWDFIQPKIDRDGCRYKEKVLKNKYAVYCRWAKQEGLPKPSFAEWLVLNQQAEETAEEGELDVIEQKTGNMA